MTELIRYRNQTIYAIDGSGDTDVYLASEVDAELSSLTEKIAQLEIENANLKLAADDAKLSEIAAKEELELLRPHATRYSWLCAQRRWIINIPPDRAISFSWQMYVSKHALSQVIDAEIAKRALAAIKENI